MKQERRDSKARKKVWLRSAGILGVVCLALFVFFSGSPKAGVLSTQMDGLELDQNFPNPFNNRTEIGFTIPTNGKVLLRVFNTLGQEVQVLEDETKLQGHYTARFDGTSYPSGQYTYTLFFTSDDGTSGKLTKKMYLVR